MLYCAHVVHDDVFWDFRDRCNQYRDMLFRPFRNIFPCTRKGARGSFWLFEFSFLSLAQFSETAASGSSSSTSAGFAA